MTTVEFGAYQRDFGHTPRTRTLDEVQDMHDFDFELFCRRRKAETGRCAVMDVGCGNSTALVELAERVGGLTILGVDIYNAAERRPWPDERIGLQPEIQCTGNAMPAVPDQSQDLIISTWSVSAYGVHTDTFAKRPTSYVTEFGRILRPGGLASIRPENRLIELFIYGDEAREQTLISQTPGSGVRGLLRLVKDYRDLVAKGYQISFDDDIRTTRIRRTSQTQPDASEVTLDANF